jgi:tRNA-dihydrouridine synthase
VIEAMFEEVPILPVAVKIRMGWMLAHVELLFLIQEIGACTARQ